MKTITIEVPEDVKNVTQRADIECSARRDIITHILEKNIAVPAERMAAYQKEYDEKYFAFEQAKSKLEREYVRKAVSNPINWSLDYHTNIVTITAED